MNSGKLCKNAVIYCDGKSKKEFRKFPDPVYALAYFLPEENKFCYKHQKNCKESA